MEILKQDKALYKYTIKAIVAETGFGNAESFTRAFYQKNGIYPPYYNKQPNKEEAKAAGNRPKQ